MGGVIERLATAIDALRPGARVLVAIDGPDAAGKSTMAAVLSERVRRPTLCASVDGWHRPRAVRLAQGDESPIGYYESSFDHDALLRELLRPFRSGAGTVTTSCFDYRADEPCRTEVSHIPRTAALLFDGVFLLRPELRACWDLSVYLHVPEDVTLARALARDAASLGGADAVRRRYEHRYLPGQALYRSAAGPLDLADIALDNTEPAAPLVLHWRA